MSDSRILLIEDNTGDEELTLRALRRGNIQNPVTVARDGAEAITLLATGDLELPRLILLDLNLPKIGGIEVLRRIRAEPRTSSVPVVILSSSGEERDRVDAYAAGANSYVVKPVEFTEFADAVCQVGRYWLTLNEPPPK